MTDDFTAFSRSQKLVRCLVRNSDGGESLRYVELENFQLWRYMMENKHQLEIDSETLCVWIHAEEYAAKQELYARAGNAVRVVRLVLMVFDEVSSYCHTIERYAPRDDAKSLQDMLLSYVPETARTEDRCESHWIEGYCIDRDALGEQTALILGLNAVNG